MYSRRQFLNRFMISTGGAFIALKTDAFARATEAIEKLNPSISALESASDEDFWGRIQSAFDVDRSLINLNNGGVSPSPRVVIDAFKRYIDYSNQAPSYYMWQHVEPKVETVREKLAIVFGCDKEEIAITRNDSESLQIIQLGLDFKPGDEILTTTQDYPRMLTTFNQMERRIGIKVNKVQYPTPLVNKNDYVESLKNGITPKTKIILISHTCFLTGQILPVRDVCRAAHEKGIEVIVDGAHSFNHFPYTLADLECDYFGTSLHKWTYAPIGTGMLYVKRNLIKKVWPLMAATKEMEDNIRKFEEIGTHPAANHNAIAEALAFNEAIGIDRKAERFRYLHKRWINRVKKYDNVKFLIDIKDESNWAGIINFNIKGVDINKLQEYLFNKHRIYVIVINFEEFKGLRVTPNVYTMISEIDFFADVIESAARGEIKEVME
ncbi:MAG: aminotransferase class V-fold PLP-dependent enzyme [Melioribacter sp.]|nr:aminotransferase class V-fold PLP-dependent enzyme [Melioribacter sp.]